MYVYKGVPYETNKMTLLEQQNTATDYMFLYLKQTHQNKNGFLSL